jgi:hypothetical protein
MDLTRRNMLIALLAAVVTGAGSGSLKAGSLTMTSYVPTLKDVVGPEIFKQAGLEKLSQEEQFILREWIERRINDMARFVEEECRKGNIR